MHLSISCVLLAHPSSKEVYLFMTDFSYDEEKGEAAAALKML